VTRSRDEVLVRRYLEGRAEDAFRVLYREYSPYLFGLALRISGGRRDEAEEALQEAWIRAAQKLDGFRWNSALKTWLAGFVVNCCREARRRRPGAGELALTELTVAEEPSQQPSDGGRIDIERLLGSLPDAQRDVLILFAIEGYTHAEIGRLLEIATGTSKSRLFEARRNLRHWQEARQGNPGETS